MQVGFQTRLPRINIQFIANVQLWFTRHGSVSIREQLVTQIMLAIASGEIEPGKRLPSTRMLARRFGLHPNTVSAAYRELEERHWVESVHGSGVFARSPHPEPCDDAQVEAIDRLVRSFLQAARAAGASAPDLQTRLDRCLSNPARQFVIVHPEETLRAIISRELQPALTWTVNHCGLDATAIKAFDPASTFLTVPSVHTVLRKLAPSSAEVIPLKMRAVARSLAAFLPAQPQVLTAVASIWPAFLDIARTFLTAAGYHPDSILLRNPTSPDWTRGLAACPAVVCDVLTADAIPEDIHKITFPLIADSSINALKALERFHAGTLPKP
jgi:DNA-binding transcriptional regulator YhcF (GntR family)